MSKTALPRISVITVSFNQAEFIKQNIESVLQQNYPNFEHLVIDGGSRDGTIEILEAYPHLQWTSEPDRGQTHALNKGFARATGDIIAWINSDDWYPPGVFHAVADELSRVPVIMGACQSTDKYGKSTVLTENTERNWFDILKYWIYHSSPAQPSVFFRRSVLEEFRRPDGSYLDEDLDFCMDYEFWLRIGAKYPLNRRIDRVLSYNRSYDINKTGQDMDLVYREMSRVFSRYSVKASCAERKLSFVIPFTEFTESLGGMVDSISRQTVKDCEVLLVDYSADPKKGKQNRRAVLDCERTKAHLNVRYRRSQESGRVAAVNQGIISACATLVAVLEEGAIIPEDLCFEAGNLFRNDTIALALPLRNQPQLDAVSSPLTQGGKILNVSGVLSGPSVPLCFIARKVALLELGGFKSSTSGITVMRELLIRLVAKGWNVDVNNSFDIKPPPVSDPVESDRMQVLDRYITAKIISDLNEEQALDQFGQLRIKNGFSINLPAELIRNSAALLAKAPGGWLSLGYETPESDLTEITSNYPEFAPGWFFLAAACKADGNEERARLAISKFESLRDGEIL